ncbi:hypothetical protein M5K25_018706 [Dendrobium thyrsiflorum]|uniref:Uncharacterized protein n=1 Tax=Dendrobium thyrsiflorum TaxID=117978 RepID=A0ABD0UJB0_DENTH
MIQVLRMKKDKSIGRGDRTTKSKFEKKVSELETQILAIHEKVNGKFAIMEETMRKMLEVQIKITPLEARGAVGNQGSGENPNPIRQREDVEILEGEERIPLLEPIPREESELETQILANHEKIDGKFATMEQMMRKMLEVQTKTTPSKARGAIGGQESGETPNPKRRREYQEVEILKGKERMPPLEPIPREESGRGKRLIPSISYQIGIRASIWDRWRLNF